MSTQRSSNHTRPTDQRTSEVQAPTKHPPRSAAEKLRIVEEYDSYPTGAPERGALLRREGIYTSAIAKWRKLRRTGTLHALTPQRPGPKPAFRDPREHENEQLRRENARLQARLAQAEAIIDVQKKVATLLGASLPALATDEP
jgi:transposase